MEVRKTPNLCCSAIRSLFSFHHAQVIDVREEDSFKAGHILGARNIPFSQFKMYIGGIRKDMPVYLYEQGKALALRCAIMLKKEGFDKIFVLKGGYNKWDGKKKKN